MKLADPHIWSDGYMPPRGIIPGGYFIGGDGLKYDFMAISLRLKNDFDYTKKLKGKHISIQLEYLGILEKFETGTTPRQLPFSF